MLPASKSVPYEGSIHIPLVVRWDAVVRHPRVESRLVSNLDFAPTEVRLAGYKPASVEGRSFMQLITRPSHPWPQHAILLEHQYDHHSWKIGRAPSFCAVRTTHYMFSHYSGGFEELYDLSTDPYELHNLIDVDTALAAQLRAKTNAMCRPRPPLFHW